MSFTELRPEPFSNSAIKAIQQPPRCVRRPARRAPGPSGCDHAGTRCGPSGASSSGRTRPRSRPRHPGPPPSFHLRPHSPASGGTPTCFHTSTAPSSRSIALRVGIWHGAADVEHPPDRRLDPRQRPPLAGEAVFTDIRVTRSSPATCTSVRPRSNNSAAAMHPLPPLPVRSSQTAALRIPHRRGRRAGSRTTSAARQDEAGVGHSRDGDDGGHAGGEQQRAVARLTHGRQDRADRGQRAAGEHVEHRAYRLRGGLRGGGEAQRLQVGYLAGRAGEGGGRAAGKDADPPELRGR